MSVRRVLGAVAVVAVLGVGCSDGEGDARDADGEESDERDAEDASGGEAESESDAQGGGDSGEGLTAPEDIEAPEGSDPELRQEYIDQLVVAAGGEEVSGLDDRTLACLSTAYVDAAGTEALGAVVTPEELAANQDKSPAELGIELPEGAGDAFYDELTSCVDMRAVYLDGTAGGDAALRECLDEAIDEELFREYLIATYVGNTSEPDPELVELAGQLEAAAGTCGGLAGG